MTIQPKRREFDYCGYIVSIKANPSSTNEGAWFPSYQISGSEEHVIRQPAGWVTGSDDFEWVLEEAARLAKEHIHALLTA